MLAADDEIELVDEIIVAGVGPQMQRQRGDPQDQSGVVLKLYRESPHDRCITWTTRRSAPIQSRLGL